MGWVGVDVIFVVSPLSSVPTLPLLLLLYSILFLLDSIHFARLVVWSEREQRPDFEGC